MWDSFPHKLFDMISDGQSIYRAQYLVNAFLRDILLLNKFASSMARSDTVAENYCQVGCHSYQKALCVHLGPLPIFAIHDPTYVLRIQPVDAAIMKKSSLSNPNSGSFSTFQVVKIARSRYQFHASLQSLKGYLRVYIRVRDRDPV